MRNLTEVVKNLLIINVIVFAALNFTFLGNFFDYFVLFPTYHPSFQPVQFLTHMFNHAPINSGLGVSTRLGMMHIIGNMMALYFFGPNVERVWGPKRFLFFYLACGFGAVLMHILFGGGAVLGASGAIAGVLLAFAYLYPNAKVMLLIPPIPMKAKFLVLGLLAMDLFLGFSPAQTGIAHFAHIGGALMGALLILVFNKNPGFMR